MSDDPAPGSPVSEAGEPATSTAEQGGEAACWLHRVCAVCGSIPDDPGVQQCPRCGSSGRLG